MALLNKNLSTKSLPIDTALIGCRFGIVVATWNEQVTESLYLGAYQKLKEVGVEDANIIRMSVPGAFELSLGSQWMARRETIDAVICLGCVIQGETRHFDFICEAVSQGITNVSLKFNKPVIFGVLTTNSMEQAIQRSGGGKKGNKGTEAVKTAIKMLQTRQEFYSKN